MQKMKQKQSKNPTKSNSRLRNNQSGMQFNTINPNVINPASI